MRYDPFPEDTRFAAALTQATQPSEIPQVGANSPYVWVRWGVLCNLIGHVVFAPFLFLPMFVVWAMTPDVLGEVGLAMVFGTVLLAAFGLIGTWLISTVLYLFTPHANERFRIFQFIGLYVASFVVAIVASAIGLGWQLSVFETLLTQAALWCFVNFFVRIGENTGDFELIQVANRFQRAITIVILSMIPILLLVWIVPGPFLVILIFLGAIYLIFECIRFFYKSYRILSQSHFGIDYDLAYELAEREFDVERRFD